MEALSATLQPYKEPLGQVASIITIAQFFSGFFICKDIYGKKSTENISCTPFTGGIIIGVLMLYYAELLQDPAMLQVNVAAILLNAFYIIFYHIYSKNRWDEIYKSFFYGIALIIGAFSYTYVEDPEKIEYRYGLFVTVLMLLLLGAPLGNIKTIIETKDASSIPFPITFMGAIVSFLWFIYGIILLNIFMIVQNFIGFMLCMMQLILIVIYPKKPETNRKKNQ